MDYGFTIEEDKAWGEIATKVRAEQEKRKVKRLEEEVKKLKKELKHVTYKSK